MEQELMEHEETFVTELPSTATNPLDLPVEVFVASLDRRKQNRQALVEWVKDALKPDVDYGRIHVVSKGKCQATARKEECNDASHYAKDSLWKPGAEKISGMLGLIVHYPNIGDYEQAAVSGVDINSIVLRCHLLDGSGNIVAEGIGARDAKKDDWGDLNKALKMACKSAHIDATLRCAGLSEVFTQDMDEQTHTKQSEPESAPIAEAAPEVELMSLDCVAVLSDLIKEVRKTKEARTNLRDRIYKKYRVTAFHLIPASRYESIVAGLEKLKEKV